MVAIFPCCSFHLIYLGSRRHHGWEPVFDASRRPLRPGLVYIISGHGESAHRSLRRELKAWIVQNGYKNAFMVDPLSQVGAAAPVAKARELGDGQQIAYETGRLCTAGGKNPRYDQELATEHKRKAENNAGTGGEGGGEGKRFKTDPTQRVGG